MRAMLHGRKSWLYASCRRGWGICSRTVSPCGCALRSLSGGSDGTVEAALPLDLPGRGLYKLAVSASSGDAEARAETSVAVVFAPAETDPKSPWGIFWVPVGDNPRDAARSIRLLGASWARFNFWAFSFDRIAVTEGPEPEVSPEYSRWKRHARALHDEGLFIMGEIAQCPRVLSSRPDDTSSEGDAGPMWARVKPRDYALWDQLMEKLAQDFSSEIDVWEIWNEPNIGFWEGTVEEYAELVEHTARAFRRGNPDARIAAGGFVAGFDFVGKLFQLGLGDNIDILSVHYTDEKPAEIARWRDLLAKHDLSLPIWNSEEKSEIPLRNLAGGVERSFKFIHVEIGYPDYRPLVARDLTVLPAGIAFSVAAHCIGAGEYAGECRDVPGFEVHFFRRGDEIVAVFQRAIVKDRTKLFEPKATRLTLAVEPLDEASAPVATDILGRSRPLAIADGRAELSLDPALSVTSSTPGAVFVNGARRVEVVEVNDVRRDNRISVFEAESGRWSDGWSVIERDGFFGGKTVDIWADADPGPEGYWVELPIKVTRPGRYEVVFSGNPLKRLRRPRSLSPFTWSIDAGKKHVVDAPVPTPAGPLGAVGGLGSLGTVDLTGGWHAFRLALTASRDAPDNRYALWFDALILRRK